MGALKARRVFQAIQQARSREELLATIRSPESREVAIDLIASESHVPRFIATRVYNLLLRRFAEEGISPAPAPAAGATAERSGEGR